MYEISKLLNGLRVVTVPMPDRESVGVGVWVRVGSRYEPGHVSGISHFIEHLVFKGTRYRSSRQIKESIEGVGGNLNAFTAEEYTCYIAKLPQEHLELALDVLSDMVRNPLFRRQDFEKERQVILEEIKMYLDLPMQIVQELLSDLLWPGQPLGMNIAGTEKTVSGLKLRHVKSFRARHYHPANIAVAVAGPVRHDAVRRFADTTFRASSRGPSRFKRARSGKAGPMVRCQEKKTEQTHLALGFHTYPRLHPERFALVLLHVLLGANMSSRLFEEVRERRGLAYDVKTHVSAYEDTGAFTVSAGVENKKARLAVRVILSELEKIARRAPQEPELARAKDYYVGQLTLGLEDTLDHMLWVGERMLYSGEMPWPSDVVKHIRRVTAREVSQVAHDIFKSSKLRLALVSADALRLEKDIRKEVGLW